MSVYSLKMRASRQNGLQAEHVSGAEKILAEEELPEQMQGLLERALHHAKGKADFVNMKIEAIDQAKLQYIDALPVSTHPVSSPAEGRAYILSVLQDIGIHNGPAIMEHFKDTYGMRGAMLLDVDTLERLEPDHSRGIRATYMDAEHSLGRTAAAGKNHFQEAIVLASKVLHAPHIIAEICMSDDPDYITGYIATRKTGYVRITKMKEMGCPDGGRIFLYRGDRNDVAACMDYLEKQRVLVRHVPLTPAGDEVNITSPWAVYEKILQDKRQKHLYRETQEIATVQAPHIICRQKEQLLLASNNYLGLIDHDEVKAAAVAAVQKYGTGSGGARLTTGTLTIHNELERQLADFKGTEAGILFNTGYMANVGIISALGIKGSVIFSDERNHASIIDGCRLSHAKTVIYRHNDMHDLEEKLKLYAPCQGLIVTDAVFSMDGDIADLPQIMELAARYKVLTMVDEAHAIGVIGETGRGIVEHFAMQQKPDVLMGTLSKSLASEGGYACGSQLLIDYLRNTARSYIFSTSLCPAAIAAADKALSILRREPERVRKLRDNTAAFCESLQQNGIDAHSESAIVPIILRDEKLAMMAAAELQQKGIFLSAIRYPTVAKGEARLRAAIMATHSKEELRDCARTIAEVITRTKLSLR